MPTRAEIKEEKALIEQEVWENMPPRERQLTQKLMSGDLTFDEWPDLIDASRNQVQ